MWMTMTVPVASVLFLLTVYFAVRGSSANVFPMDMAQNSVDDSFEGCRPAMNALVESNYTEYEKKHTPGFKTAWEDSLQNAVNAQLGKYQSAAIYMYTRHPTCRIDCSYTQFNNATNNGKKAYKSGHFQFYTLFFYLTEAIQQLKQNQPKCVTVYRRTKVKFPTNVKNKNIRFGFFTSTSFDQYLHTFGSTSCFEVKTCYGAAIENYSAIQDEREVLIPPYEVFRVTSIEMNTWCDVVYILESAGKRSNLKCAKSSSSAAAGPSLLSILLFTAVWVKI